MGLINSDGTVLKGLGYFSVRKTATGQYRVELGASQTLLSVTANPTTMGHKEAEAPLIDFPTVSQHGFVLRNRVGPYTSFRAADHMWTFIAFVRGNQLPAYTRDLYPFAGTIDHSAGPLAGQSGLSSTYSSKGYEVRFQTGDSILFSTVGLYYNPNCMRGIVTQLDTGNTNKIRYYGVLGDNPSIYSGGAVIAIAEHNVLQPRPEIANIRVISGIINADGAKRSGSGFSTSQSSGLIFVNFDRASKILAFDPGPINGFGIWVEGRQIDQSPRYYLWWSPGPSSVVFTAVIEVSN